VDIIHHQFNDADSSFTQRRVETIELNETSFVKLTPFHLNKEQQTSIVVQGLDASSNLVVEDQWVSQPPQYGSLVWEPYCEAICNGSTYAYKIDLSEQVNVHTEQQRTKRSYVESEKCFFLL
jgi:hypothetical protein